MRVRPSMDMIVNYIEKDPYKIKYPDRDATFYMNSPQFLNILNEGGLDMTEQSQNLAKQQLRTAQARAGGRGGAVDVAMVGEGSESEAGSYVSLSSTGDSDYRRRVEAETERLREQERVRQENEDFIRRQREAIEKANEEKKRRAAESAAAAASSSTAHPVAAAAAAPLLTGTRDPVYAPTPGAPFATQSPNLLPSAQANILFVPRPANEVGMSSGSQPKRAGEGEGNGSPKAKARGDVQPPVVSTGEGEASSNVKPTKKTETKSEGVKKLESDLRDDMTVASREKK
jgi:hypothetical protein